MEPAILGVVLDSSVIIEAERKHQTVEELLEAVQQRYGEVEIAVSAITIAELVHGVARANTVQRRDRRRLYGREAEIEPFRFLDGLWSLCTSRFFSSSLSCPSNNWNPS